MRTELRFSIPGSDEEQVRVYEGISCKEAVEKFNEEFPDQETRPSVHHMIVDNTSKESHNG